MTEESPESFDAEYVKSLRQEAGKYRTQVKDLKAELDGYKGLEAQLSTIRIENELVRRGIQAEPSWVQMQDGENPSQAVDSFLEKYPQFASGSIEVDEKVEPKSMPKAMPPQPSNPNAGQKWAPRSLEDVEADPKARQQLVEQYRSLLSHNE